MPKRGKVKGVDAEAAPSVHDEQAAVSNPADIIEHSAGSARKRPRAAKHQRKTTKKQATGDASAEAAAADAEPTAARSTSAARSRRQRQQEQVGDTQQQPDQPDPNQQKASRSKKQTAASAAEKPPYYLVKSEPNEFSIDDLEAKPNQTEPWEGIRNAQARNIMRGMQVGDLAFFYHSSCKVPGIVGIAKVVREAYPDSTAFDPSSKYHDPSSSEDKPKWWMVDWQLVRRLKRQVTLEELKSHKEGALEGMALFNRPRLSVQPVTKEQWDFVMSLEENGDE